MIERERPTGIVLPPPLSNEVNLLSGIQQAGARVAAVSANEWVRKVVSSAGIDERAGSYTFGRYLASLGHRHIGFLEAFRDAGIQLRPWTAEGLHLQVRCRGHRTTASRSTAADACVRCKYSGVALRRAGLCAQTRRAKSIRPAFASGSDDLEAERVTTLHRSCLFSRMAGTRGGAANDEGMFQKPLDWRTPLHPILRPQTFE
jgi:hypothetical protein